MLHIGADNILRRHGSFRPGTKEYSDVIFDRNREGNSIRLEMEKGGVQRFSVPAVVYDVNSEEDEENFEEITWTWPLSKKYCHLNGHLRSVLHVRANGKSLLLCSCMAGKARVGDSLLGKMENCVRNMLGDAWTEEKDIDQAFNPILLGMDNISHQTSVSMMECIHTSVVKHRLKTSPPIESAVSDDNYLTDEGNDAYVCFVEREGEDQNYPYVRVHVSKEYCAFSSEVVYTLRKKFECVRHSWFSDCPCIVLLKEAMKGGTGDNETEVEMRNSIVIDDHNNTTVSWKPRPFKPEPSKMHSERLPESVQPLVKCMFVHRFSM